MSKGWQGGKREGETERENERESERERERERERGSWQCERECCSNVRGVGPAETLVPSGTLLLHPVRAAIFGIPSRPFGYDQV